MRLAQAYKFCPRCGTKGQTKNTYLHCLACGLDTYFSSKPTNCIILRNQNSEYLLVERAFDPKKGWWDLPGGFVDSDEDFEQSIRREVLEELGIELGPIKYVGSFTQPYDFQGITYDTVTVCYAADLPLNVQLKPADDVASVKFFKADELPYDRFAFPNMKKVFELV